jgi:hypothetical protein
MQHQQEMKQIKTAWNKHAGENKMNPELQLNYGFEKLHSACHTAIGSSETPQKRLASAVSFNLTYIRRENLPNEEAWEQVQKIRDAASSKPAEGDEGTIEATTSQMSDDEAAKYLREILDVFSEVAEEIGRLRGSASA